MPYSAFLADRLPAYLTGVLTTIELTILSIVLAVIVALVMGLMRLSKNPFVTGIAYCYIEFFRGTSLYVQVFWVYFVLPIFGVTLNPFVAGFTAVGLNIGAYGAELVRGAILSVPKGQYEAAYALSMSDFQRMRRIILPQALPIMLPPWGNLLIELLKGTAICAMIGVVELTFQAKQINSSTFLSAQAFGTSLILYYVLARFGITPFMRWLEKFTARRMGRST